MKKELRTSIIRYWEKRRIVYNLALVPPTLFGYLPLASWLAFFGDRTPLRNTLVALCFFTAILGANLCYSFCYVLEFFLANEDPESAWLRRRKAVFVAGTLLGMSLAWFGGRNIAFLEYMQ